MRPMDSRVLSLIFLALALFIGFVFFQDAKNFSIHPILAVKRSTKFRLSEVERAMILNSPTGIRAKNGEFRTDNIDIVVRESTPETHQYLLALLQNTGGRYASWIASKIVLYDRKDCSDLLELIAKDASAAPSAWLLSEVGLRKFGLSSIPPAQFTKWKMSLNSGTPLPFHQWVLKNLTRKLP